MCSYLHRSISLDLFCQILFYFFYFFKWEHRVEKSQEEFETISKSIIKEMKRFERQRFTDFKSTIIAYLESLMANQQQVQVCAFLQFYHVGAEIIYACLKLL